MLFSDLRDFTTLTETMAPDELVSHLNAYFNRMVDAIAAQGGVVDKFIGDAVMATFGGVVPHSQPCDAAVAAAQQMHQALQELNLAWAVDGQPPLRMGIGIDYGDVLQGSLGSRARKQFTVIGDTVNTAARVEAETKAQKCATLDYRGGALSLVTGESRVLRPGRCGAPKRQRQTKVLLFRVDSYKRQGQS